MERKIKCPTSTQVREKQFFFQVQGILYQAREILVSFAAVFRLVTQRMTSLKMAAKETREIQNSMFKSVKSQGILFLFSHKVCKGVSSWATLMSYQKIFMEEIIVFCGFIASCIAKGFVLDEVKIGL